MSQGAALAFLITGTGTSFGAMESGYKSRILGFFRDLSMPKIENLDIPDEYEYMDDELVEISEQGVEFHIQNLYRKLVK